MYNHYDQQFAEAGSPSKVEETIGSGTLPSQPEYVLADVASLFKKIIIGLPGGLLGSLELFEAIRSIMVSWSGDFHLSTSENSRLRARLVALAISSSSSMYRIHLIEAVLGLVAYFGFEAEKALEEERAAYKEEGEPRMFKSELMGYQSLGVVLGPLLLGDQTDNIEVGTNASDDLPPDTTPLPRRSTESTQDKGRKSKKQKRISLTNILEKKDDFTVHVDRANLTAKVMQSLLVNWKEVVEQLKELSNSGDPMARSANMIRKVPNYAASGLTLKNQEEEIDFFDMLRGRPLPDELTEDYKMKSRVRMTSRSPIRGRGHGREHHSPKDSSQERTWLPDASLTLRDDAGFGGENIEEPNSHHSRMASSTKRSHAKGSRGSSQGETPKSNRSLTGSDNPPDVMSMGTILPRREHSPFAMRLQPSSRGNIASQTPYSKDRSQSSNDGSSVPETAIKIRTNTEYRKPSITLVGQSSIDKPLPPIGPTQEAELSPQTPEGAKNRALRAEPSWPIDLPRPSRPSTDISPSKSRRSTPRTLFPSRGSGTWIPTSDDSVHPPRKSSLSGGQRGPERVIEPFPPFEKPTDDQGRSGSRFASTSRPSTSRLNSIAPHSEGNAEAREEHGDIDDYKFLTDRFSEISAFTRDGEETHKISGDRELPTIRAFIRPLPSSMSSDDDPFISFSSLNPEGDSMIPNPVRDFGHARHADSPGSHGRTPSPQKRDALHAPEERSGNRPSTINSDTDRRGDLLESNPRSRSEPRNRSHVIDRAADAVSPSPGTLRRSATGVFEPNIFSRDSKLGFLSELGHVSKEDMEDSHEKPQTAYGDDMDMLSAQHTPSLRSDVLPAASLNSLEARAADVIDEFSKASEALRILGRRNSTKKNVGLYQVAIHFERIAKNSQDREQATKRELDAIKEIGRADSSHKGSPRSSWGKNQGNEESAKEALAKQVDFWKAMAEKARARAEQAEKEKALAQQTSALAEKRLAEKIGDRRSANVEIIMDTERPAGQERGGIYVDEGWDGGDLEDPEMEAEGMRMLARNDD